MPSRKPPTGRKVRTPPLPPDAVAADLPASLAPLLATLVARPPAGDWLYEIKFDGYRMLARVDADGEVRIVTRRGNDWSARFPSLHRELARARLPPGWYDGEIVLLDGSGKPDFNGLQNAIEGGRNDDIVFYLFDVPYLRGHDLRAVPVEQRRALLESTLPETQHLRFSQEIDGAAGAILASACRLGLEGVIGKRRGSRYSSGRSDAWIKLKCVQREEFVIGGYTWPDNSRSDPGLGALLVGQLDEDGVLQYAGKVGTGFSGEMSTLLRARLDAIAQPRRPFAGPTGHDRHASWVRPELVCEVSYNEWPDGGALRHASFKGLREDKPAASVRREPVVDVDAERPPSAKAPAKKSTPKQSTAKMPAAKADPAAAAKRAPAAAKAAVSPPPIKVTSGSRVIDPSTGLTKLDLVRYYAQVSPWAMPHLQGRPLYIRRAPKGIAAGMVFQQHTLGMRGLRAADPALWPGHDPAIAIDTPEELVAAAQMDAVELHTWSSTAAAIRQPDRMIFDLDPGDDVPWPQVQEAALLVRALLHELGLKAWLKTTGGKGLHLFVPLRPQFGYDTVKDFSEAVVQHLARTIPQRFVAKSGPRNRVGRIFVDYLRNGWVQSTAEALSARARPGLGVSMPLAWEELADTAGASDWTIVNAPDHLASRKRDPWADYFRTRQPLASAMKKLGFAPTT